VARNVSRLDVEDPGALCREPEPLDRQLVFHLSQRDRWRRQDRDGDCQRDDR
jgi:hypothetical protein